MCVRPGDKFALCCLICGYCPPPESSLQLDFNLCIMSREWETKQKQKQKLNRNGTERGAGRGCRNRTETESCKQFAHPIHTGYTRFPPVTPVSFAELLSDKPFLRAHVLPGSRFVPPASAFVSVSVFVSGKGQRATAPAPAPARARMAQGHFRLAARVEFRV